MSDRVAGWITLLFVVALLGGSAWAAILDETRERAACRQAFAESRTASDSLRIARVSAQCLHVLK